MNLVEFFFGNDKTADLLEQIRKNDESQQFRVPFVQVLDGSKKIVESETERQDESSD